MNDFEHRRYIPELKPPVKLIGEDGNAFFILSRCKRAAQEEGWAPEAIAAFETEATRGDYSHLLSTVCEFFEVAWSGEEDDERCLVCGGPTELAGPFGPIFCPNCDPAEVVS